MKVAFWSASDEIGDVTGYLAAIGVFCASFYKKEVFIGRNYLSGHTAEDCFFDHSARCGKEIETMYYVYGEPAYFRKLWENKRQSEEVITMTGIHLLPPPDVTDTSVFYRNTGPDALYFVGVMGKINASVAQVLDEADLIAVFLSQNIAEVTKFFENYSSLISKALIFFADCRQAMEDMSAYLETTYGVSEKNIGSFVLSEAFLLACEQGNIENFVCENLKQGGERDRLLMQSVQSAAQRIVLWKTGKTKESEEGYEVSQK